MARKKGSSSKDFAVPSKGGNKSNIVQQDGNDGTVHQQTHHPGGGGKNNVASQLQALTDRMKAMEDRAERAEAKVEKLQEELESAKKTTKASDQVSKRTRARDAEIDARFRKMESENNALKRRVCQLETTTQELHNEREGSAGDEDHSRCDKAIEDLGVEVHILQIQSRIARAGACQGHDSGTEKIATLERKLSGLDAGLDALEEKVRGLPNRANTFTQREVTAVRAHLANLELALEGTDEVVADVRNDMSQEQNWSYEVEGWRDEVLVPGLRQLSRRTGTGWDRRPVEVSDDELD